MKKYFIVYILLLTACVLQAQQNVQYTQFMLNEYGLNPATAGNSRGIMFMVGRRVQWGGFELAPESNFASVTKSFGKKGYKRYWHGVGAYVEQDKFGVFSNKSAYASYAIHLKMSSKYYFSFGIAAGVKSYAVSNSIFDADDPAIMNRAAKVIVPDIIPGVYLYSKKLVAGVAVRNLYSNTLKQGDKEIGTGSKLLPNAYITVARKFVSEGYDFIFVPAIHLQTSFVTIPVSNFNLMVYYRKRVGLGVSYRMHDAVSGMIQVRIFSNIVVGFSYDYTISKFRAAHANSTEFMFGFSPIMSTENYDRPQGAANCPKFEL
jgi:type IX secretion system PorP/SprF family membrane protein